MRSIYFLLILSLFIYSSSSNVGYKLAQCAKEQYGKSFKTGALGPDYFDDFGLVYYCMKQLNLPCFIDRKSQAQQGKKISNSELQPGDVLYAYDKKYNLISAIIYYGYGKVIYTTYTKGVIINNIANLNYEHHYDYRRNY